MTNPKISIPVRLRFIKRIPNDEVSRIAGTKRSLFETVKKRKLSFVGHIMQHDSVQRDLEVYWRAWSRAKEGGQDQWNDNITK